VDDLQPGARPSPQIQSFMAADIIERSRVEQNKLNWLVFFLGGVTFLLAWLRSVHPYRSYWTVFSPTMRSTTSSLPEFRNRGFSSFDGIHFTNGYQPLWFIALLRCLRSFQQAASCPCG